jgi:iron-sulfur cluster insertion protein
MSSSTQQTITMTKQAVARIAELIEKQQNDKLMLRLTVSGGGCSGFQYGFKLDDHKNNDDIFFTDGGVTLVIDPASLDILGGSEVDYVEDLIGASFQIKNPNAASSCGCGTSFSI